jgi:hypothetical protein
MPRHPSQNPLAAGGPRRPPDYTTRPVKLRLFGLLAALMVVLAVAERARDPQTWAWFKNADEQAAEREAQPNPRLEPARFATADDPLGTFIAANR